jgi:hypothetical protein
MGTQLTECQTWQRRAQRGALDLKTCVNSPNDDAMTRLRPAILHSPDNRYGPLNADVIRRRDRQGPLLRTGILSIPRSRQKASMGIRPRFVEHPELVWCLQVGVPDREGARGLVVHGAKRSKDVETLRRLSYVLVFRVWSAKIHWCPSNARM